MNGLWNTYTQCHVQVDIYKCIFLNSLWALPNWCYLCSLLGDDGQRKRLLYSCTNKHLGRIGSPKIMIIHCYFSGYNYASPSWLAETFLQDSLYCSWTVSARFHFCVFILAFLSVRAVCMVWDKDTVHCVSKSELLWNSEKYTLFSLYVCLCASVGVCYSSCGIYTVHVVQCSHFLKGSLCRI